MKSIYNIYSLLSVYKRIRSHRIKALGLLVSSLIGMRHLSLRIDPALYCNYSCQMCYFSVEEKRKSMKGQLSIEDMEQLSEVFFSKAFQLVVGCGAEPTMNKNFMHLLRLAKQSNIPNVSVVTNGALLNESHVSEMVELGVDEIIVSAHGLTKNNYERFMVNGKFEDFISLLQTIQRVKTEKKSNKPKVRINYTANEINLKDLEAFADFNRLYSFQTLQVRPVMDIGGVYTKKLNSENEKLYNEIIDDLKKECVQRNIKLLANTADIGYSNGNNKDSYIIESVYTYLSPETKRQYETVFAKGSLFQYKRVTKWYTLIIKGMFGRHNSSSDTDNFLKYDVL